ncbi:MAG: glucan biosynthesis protein, partial [Bacteroidota bacterium]
SILLLLPIFLKMRKNESNRLSVWLSSRIKSNPYHLFWLVMPLFIYEAALEPFFDVTHALVNDWFNFISSMTLFFYGFLLMSVKDEFFVAINKIKGRAVVIGTVAFGVMVLRWLYVEDGLVVHLTEALLKVVNFWAWIIAIFGFAATYLNKSSQLLTYCNRAVYPFYILHQTVTIVIAYNLMNLDWGLAPKFLLLLLGTFVISFLLYELLIRRIALLRPLFGLKWKQN